MSPMLSLAKSLWSSTIAALDLPCLSISNVDASCNGPSAPAEFLQKKQTGTGFCPVLLTVIWCACVNLIYHHAAMQSQQDIFFQPISAVLL